MTNRADSFDSRILKWGGAAVVAFIAAAFVFSAGMAAPSPTAALGKHELPAPAAAPAHRPSRATAPTAVHPV